jgi:hypothetical protein
MTAPEPIERAQAPIPGASAVPGEDIVPSATVTEAWTRWLDAGSGVPRGLTAFLRSATVRDVDGVVQIVPPPGPSVERLAEASVQAAIRVGLAPWLGRTPLLHVESAEPSGGAPERARRISREEVRADTLKALYRKEPSLEQAVEELDLELME